MRRLLHTPKTALLLLLVFHLLVNCWWLCADNHPIRADEETHMLFARAYYQALFPAQGGGLLSRLDAVARIEPGNPAHPPLLHLFGALVIRVLGYSVNRLAFTGTLLFLLTLWGCYLLSRRFLQPQEAVYCVAAISFTPLIFTASRYFMTDFLSMTLVVWAMYALLQTEHLSRTRWALVFGLLNGMALLARANTPVYYVAPIIVVCVAAFVGCLMQKRHRVRRLLLVFMNGCLIILVTIVVSGPWYVLHGERFLTYWFMEHRAGSGGPLSIIQVADEAERAPRTETPAPVATATPPQKDAAAPAAEPDTTAHQPARARARPRRAVPWIRYPVFVVNHGIFLVPFLLALAGAGLLAFSRRFRASGALWLLLSSVAGAYALLTVLMSFATSRYTLQALPALMVFAVLPLVMISPGRLRRGAQWAFMAWLVFQYGNLTFRDYGPFRELGVPVYPDAAMQDEYGDAGLYLYRVRLTLGFSYAWLGAPVKENYKDRLFAAMAAEERRHALWGEGAYYARLNVRGMALEEQHYWPDLGHATPFRYPGLAERHGLTRRLRHYGWGRTVEDILPFLAVSHYVVYGAEGIDETEERRWLEVLESHGFVRVERFEEPRRARIPARAFGVLARRPHPETVAAMSGLEPDLHPLFDLYRFTQTESFRHMPDAARRQIRDRLHALIARKGRPISLNDSISFAGASVAHDRDDWYVFRLIFKADAPIRRDWRIYVHAYPLSDKETSPPDSMTPVMWNFTPAPATNFWSAGEYILVLHRVRAAPIAYDIRLGFYTNHDGYWGGAARFGPVHFGEMPRAPHALSAHWLDGPWDETHTVDIREVVFLPRLNLPPELQALRRFASPALRAMMRDATSWLTMRRP